MFLPANFAVTHSNFKFFLSIGYMLALLACFQSAAVQAQDPPTELNGSVSNNIATLVWTEAPNAVAYNVYRDNAYITTVSNNEYSESFPEGTIASYHVVAFSAPPRQFSVASERLTLPASAVPDDTTIPPSVPTNLSGEIIDTVVSLQWDASTDDEAAAGYNVYENNNYVDTVFSTQWQGSVEAGGQYRYAIVAFDIRNNFSAQSSALQLPESAAPPDTMSPPSQVTGLTGALSGGVAGNVQLSWDSAIDDQEVAGYNVYEDNQYRSTVYDTQYSAETDGSGIRSYYIVAFDFDGNFGIPSETLILPEDTVPEEDSDPPFGARVTKCTDFRQQRDLIDLVSFQ